MAAYLEIYNTALTVIQDDVVKIGDAQTGSTVDLGSIKMKNIGDSTATLVRICARCSNGLYTGQADEKGQEIITNKYLEADINDGSGWQPIGGDFSPTDSTDNYISLPDLTAGSSSNQIDFRLNLSGVTLSSFGKLRFQGYLVSYKA